MSQAKVNRIRVYACGGAGVNIGKLLEEYRGKTETGFAEIQISYVDTSKSNMDESVKEEDRYLFKGLDGSGQHRATNYETVAAHALDILQKFEPLDFNIVLSSGGGGSGSIIGPVITSELLSRGEKVVVILVGDVSTLDFAKNTYNTVLSYQAIAEKREAPVVMYYRQNGPTNPRTKVNADIGVTVTMLAALFSGQNREMDTMDLNNFLYFNIATTFQPQLASLTIIDDKTPPADLGNIIKVATLATPEVDTTVTGVKVNTQYIGFMPSNVYPDMLKKAPVHFLLSDGVIEEIGLALGGAVKEYKDVDKARVSKGVRITHDVKTTPSGVVL